MRHAATGLWVKVGVGLNAKCDWINDASCLVDTAIREDTSLSPLSSHFVVIRGRRSTAGSVCNHESGRWLLPVRVS